MDHIISRCGNKRLTDSLDHMEYALLFHGAVAENGFHVFTLDVLHNDVAEIAFFVQLNIHDVNDIGRMDAAGKFCLTYKGFKRNVSHGSAAVGTEQFQRTETIQQFMARQINFAHAPRTDTAYDGVVAQRITGRQIGVRVLIPGVGRTAECDLAAAVCTFSPVSKHPKLTFKLFPAERTDDQHSAVTAAAGNSAVGTVDIFPHHSFIFYRIFFLAIFTTHKDLRPVYEKK